MNSIGLEKVTYYMIRHKETKQIMPQAKSRRGYSHWNPSNPNTKFIGAGKTPRLFISRESAQRTIVQWFYMPNSKNLFYDDDVNIDIKNDDRKKEDLEIIKIRIIKA